MTKENNEQNINGLSQAENLQELGHEIDELEESINNGIRTSLEDLDTYLLKLAEFHWLSALYSTTEAATSSQRKSVKDSLGYLQAAY